MKAKVFLSCGLAAVVSDEIRLKLDRGEWTVDSRNILSLRLSDPLFEDAGWGDGMDARYFHVAVCNNHARKAALGCFAYLETTGRVHDSRESLLPRMELKWAGYKHPSLRIEPKESRRFDAFWFQHGNPITLGFTVHADSNSPRFCPCLDGPGRHWLRFAIMGENFPPAHRTFKLEFGQALQSVKFEEM